MRPFPVRRRDFLAAALAGPVFAARPTPSCAAIGQLRRDIVDSPVTVGLHRARTFTQVFAANDSEPWVVRKALALREYLRTVPLYLREGDRLAGSISENPGAMPVIVELGIAENPIYTGEGPERAGYLKGVVPRDIREYWMNRNMWGMYRTQIAGMKPFARSEDVPADASYKFISNQGHLSPSYSELLQVGLGGLRKRIPAGDNEFHRSAAITLEGVSEWALRYADFTPDAEMKRTVRKVATQPPDTFREALQLIWFVHQAIHIEGHGYSCTPDRLDQILYPFYSADRKAGRITDAQVIELFENLTLKMYDNTFWGPEHHLTQGLVAGGSTPDGVDQTNALSRLLIEGATNMGLPEPLIWVRWHPKIDQAFFDFCLQRISMSTCFPMLWNDKVVPQGLINAGVKREDAFNYVPVGCNELAVPGKLYFNPAAQAPYLKALNMAMKSEHATFDAFTGAFGEALGGLIRDTYKSESKPLAAQIKWGVTPLTSCFFEGCLERGQDMARGTTYNMPNCGGIFFANAVDALAAVRQVVYEKKQATIANINKACAANFQGHAQLRARLLAAPKHGNDDDRLDDIIALVQKYRDVPVKTYCRDPRDGTPFINGHVVRSSAVRSGKVTPATPDGRLAGTPLASSVGASVGCEKSGPTALLASVCRLNAAESWQGGYQVNIRFQGSMLTKKETRDKVRAMLNVYFERGGQELQINSIDTEMLRAAQKDPAQYRDLVVRIAGFSEFFVNLTPEMQEELINRTGHS